MNEEVKKNNKTTIILIVALFLSPLILSWFVFNYTDFLELRGMSNKGDLISPPRPLDDLALIDPLNDERKDSLHGKWSLAYVATTCEETCMENVYRMRQLHSSMNKHSLRVQKILFLTDQSPEDLKSKLLDYKGQQIIDNSTFNVFDLLKQFKLEETDNPINAGRLYIIDPKGNLMMSYKADTNLRDIYKDLKKLLRSSRIG
jgi:cytochrome oxidase Cu insertion factor (SCO1/SenC/PrrC family)